MKILKKFKEKYSLTDVSVCEIDIFLWQVGKRILLPKQLAKQIKKEKEKN
jgi:hypothetical protein